MVDELQVNGVFSENCYFFIDEVSKSGFLIDPGAQAGVIYEAVMRNGWHIEKILLTHGHFDHMGAAEILRNENFCNAQSLSISARAFSNHAYFGLCRERIRNELNEVARSFRRAFCFFQSALTKRFFDFTMNL